MIEFGWTTCSIKEGDWIEIPIVRDRHLDKHESVMISSSNGSACELDYCPIRETITFTPGIDCIKYKVYALADYLTEEPETFTISLLALAPNTVGINNNIIVTIIDMPMLESN